MLHKPKLSPQAFVPHAKKPAAPFGTTGYDLRGLGSAAPHLPKDIASRHREMHARKGSHTNDFRMFIVLASGKPKKHCVQNLEKALLANIS